MTKFNINFDIDLTEYEEVLLGQILQLSDNEVLEEVLNEYAKASFEEYIRMFMGQKVFTRGSDFKEYRLFLIIKNALQERIPNEEKVSSLFQLTSTESRSLIRSVMSKYQYELNGAIENSLKEALESAELTVNPHTFKGTENIITQLNRILSNLDGTLQPISKKSNTTSIYEIKPSSFNRLAEKLGIPLQQEV
ncbi:hypothetical protein AABM38_02700 [Heyndrickxia sp. MSNUG]|uniref:hypothetical protein n=1 Tax=Heyndrickxia sp. MSNUG TaxID=3136677 RepID=UPI003C306A1D